MKSVPVVKSLSLLTKVGQLEHPVFSEQHLHVTASAICMHLISSERVNATCMS